MSEYEFEEKKKPVLVKRLICMRPDDKNLLEQYAEMNQCSVSAFVRGLLRAYDRHKKGE